MIQKQKEISYFELRVIIGIIIVSMYFNKRRALANGICVSGTAAGSFVFPILIEYLIQKFGFHGTLLLLGAGMLHVCVSASLYRPLDTSDSTDSTTKTITKCENSINSTATNLTLLTTCSNNGDAKRYVEHLFMEESKNRLIDIYNANKLGEYKKKWFQWKTMKIWNGVIKFNEQISL